jgi:CubicO group peptidase (beta-lactamase class C family)
MTSTEERIQRITERVLARQPKASSPPKPGTLAERMTHYRAPGISLAVIDQDELAWAKGFGLRDITANQPVETDTLFLAGSISKSVTAFGAMRLVDQGVLTLDEDVNTWLTTWRVPEQEGWQPRLTIRQLLSHTAGLTVHGFPGYSRDQPIPTISQILDGEPPANTRAVRVHGLPGARYQYSGGGTTIVQQTMVDATGTPFPTLMRELVLDPAGMLGSTFEHPLPEREHQRAATGYYPGPTPVPGDWHVYPEMAAAGLWTTPSDLARFGIAVRAALTGKSGALLAQPLAQTMITPVCPVKEFDTGDRLVTTGFFLWDNPEQRPGQFGHTGGDEGFSAELVLFRDAPVGAIVMMNADWDASAAIFRELLSAVAVEYGWEGYVQPPAEPADEARYAGVYQTVSGYRVQVEDGERLTVTVPGQQPVPLRHLRDRHYQADALPIEIEFRLDSAGQVDGLTIHQQGVEIRAARAV